MNLTIGATNSGTLRYVRTHAIAAVTSIGLAVAALSAGVVVLSQGGGEAAVAPRASISWSQPVHDDWRQIYYIVPTQEAGEAILNAEYEQQNVILGNEGELPHRTIHVFVADSPEQERLVESMMAEVSPETTQFIDTRYPPLPAVASEESLPLSVVPPFMPEDAPDALTAPTGVQTETLFQPYPCSESNVDPSMFVFLAGTCQ